MKSEDHTGAEESTWTSFMPTMMDPILHHSSKGHDHDDKKRRFSNEQIKSLESMFETQSKLEPRQKLHLARELGLQPRQVAIWFQNKRARWKSKQLERQYTSLRRDYDSLLDSFESIKREKQLLLEKPGEKMIKKEDRPEDENHDGQIGSTLSSAAPEQEQEQEQQQQLHMQSPWPPLGESSTSCSQWWEFWQLNE